MSKKTKILIIEDNLDIADDIAKRLAHSGYNVRPAIPANSQAVQTAMAIAPDLVLIGVGSQESMNGINIAKNLYERLDIPIVFLTGYVNKALLERVKITKPFGHVFKPYDTNQLILSIENHLFWHEVEKTFIEKERRRATILNSIGEGVIACDKNGFVTYMNKVAEVLTGCSQEIAEGRPLAQVFKTEMDYAAINDRGIIDCTDHDSKLIHKDGGETPVDFTAASIIGVRGDNIGTVMVFRDMSILKAAERNLDQTVDKMKKQTQLMETVFNSMSDGVVATDEEGNFLLVNPSAEQIVGMGQTDTNPSEWSDTYGTFYPDKSTPYPTDELPLVHAMQGRKTDSVDLFQRNANKPEGVYINVSGRPLLEKEGGLRGGVIIFRDVTTLKQTEIRLEDTIEKLKSQTQFMKSIFASISDGVVVSNENAEIKILNPSAERILGLNFWRGPPEMHTLDALSSSVDFYFPDRVTPYPLDELPLRRAIQGKQTDEIQLFVTQSERYPDGAFISASGRPIRDQWGIKNGGVVVFRNITDRMLEKEALSQAFAQGRLEIVDTILHNIGNAINSVMIGIGTLHEDLAEDKLTQRFTALASAVERHQNDWVDYIKNDPQGKKVLPFILALAEDFSNRNEKLIQTIDRVTSRAAHIVDIIRTQKSYSGSSIVHKDIILPQAVADAVKLLQDSIDQRGIQIKIDCSNAPMEVHIQESQFHQMIVNLIKNSIEAIDDLSRASGLNETPSIEINGYVEGDYLVIDVTDNGIGIEPENYKKIFAAGFTTKASGSGLGLHSTANFVIGSGGQIRPLSGGIGKGTTMRIMLRLISAAL